MKQAAQRRDRVSLGAGGREFQMVGGNEFLKEEVLEDRGSGKLLK